MPRILLVEDNEMNRDMLSRRLTRNGFDIILAVNGQEGVDLALSEGPDLILMDMSLPVLDGWEATRRIKGHHKTAAIPVIALTDHALLDDVRKAMACGCDHLETKPLVYPRLMKRIRGLVERQS